MKKLILLLAVLLVAAGAFAQDISISAGAGLNYTFWAGGATDVMPDVDMEIGWSSIGVGAFIDVTYAMLNLSYTFSLGGPDVSVIIDGEKNDAASDAATEDAEDTAASYLVITALGKYPFDLGGVTIFPAIGLEYQLNMTMTDSGDDLKEDMDDDQVASLNDLYILGGAGADFNIMENIYIRALILYAYNLTPDTAETVGNDDITPWGWNLKANFSVGFKF